MGQYDHAMKSLVNANPEAIAQFVLRQWRLTRGETIQENAKVIAQLSTEFQGTEAEADGLLLMGTEEDKFLIHIEFQSKRDTIMPDRLLDYCLRARHKHGYLPITSCVIYLHEDGHMQEPPACWEVFGQKNMIFDYICIKLWEVPREEMLALNQPALLPLALLTKGEVNSIIIRDTFEELLANKLYDLLPIGQTIAAWLLRGTNLEWLKKEYSKMLDFFKDSPAYEWMTEDAREEGRQQLLTAQRQTLEEYRQILVALIAKPFPQLARLAEKQVSAIKDQKRLQQLILRVNMAQDAAEVEVLLLDLDEE